jgi:hypothetical protein
VLVAGCGLPVQVLVAVAVLVLVLVLVLMSDYKPARQHEIRNQQPASCAA